MILRGNGSVADLVAQSPCNGLLPISRGSCQLKEVDLGSLYLIAPFRDAWPRVSEQLDQTYGLTLPEPGQAQQRNEQRIVWFGREAVLLIGADHPPASQNAAITDQTDAWASVILSGREAEDVLARLVPVDLRAKVLPIGGTVRTLLRHISVSITRESDDAFLILAFRSMAHSLVEEVTQAMEAVAARG